MTTPTAPGADLATDELLPCPFCSSTNIDPEEWSGNDGKAGPGCNDCGALAETAELWNRRAPLAAVPASEPPQPLHVMAPFAPPAGQQESKGIDWQPIETAPLDRRLILFYPHEIFNGISVIGGRFDSNQYANKPRPYWSHDLSSLSGITGCRANTPSHWSLPPAGPDDQTSSAQARGEQAPTGAAPVSGMPDLASAPAKHAIQYLKLYMRREAPWPNGAVNVLENFIERAERLLAPDTPNPTGEAK